MYYTYVNMCKIKENVELARFKGFHPNKIKIISKKYKNCRANMQEEKLI